MIPDSLFGLLVIAASLTPGYVYVRVAERHNPRPERSSLLELAELVLVGASCTGISLLLALVVAGRTETIDLHALTDDTADYVLSHPIPVFLFVLGTLAGSYLLATLASLMTHRGLPATLHHHSVWHELFRKQQAGKPFATVELRDGRTVAGPVAYYTVQEGPPDCRELVLLGPIRARASGSTDYVDVTDDRVVLRAADIVALSVKYFEDV